MDAYIDGWTDGGCKPMGKYKIYSTGYCHQQEGIICNKFFKHL
jgi:hypothetical protein